MDLNQVKIIPKNKDYQNVQQAQEFYERTRLSELSKINFPEDEYPEGFKETLIGLMKFQNPVQMNVWHNREIILNDGNGGVVCTTWDNLCTFKRKFICAEMFQAIEILRRATPEEVWDSSDCIQTYKEFDGNINFWILEYFNEVAYPKIAEICIKLQYVLDGIEFQIMEPIRKKINSDLKIMNKVPLTSRIEYIKPKERRL